MATATDLTRQQLDELDTLLQRMLALPVQGTEPKPEPAPAPIPAAMPEPPAGWRADAPSSASPPHFVPPLELPEPPKPVAVPAEFGTLDLAQLTLAPPTSASIEPKATGLSPALWPLFAVNWVLENTLKLFGPPGEMLTGRAGKNLLGVCGLLMLAGAAAWTAHVQGWIDLPITPWLR